MTSKIVTNYLRELAQRLAMIEGSGVGIDADDIKQLIDLAETLDEERESK